VTDCRGKKHNVQTGESRCCKDLSLRAVSLMHLQTTIHIMTMQDSLLFTTRSTQHPSSVSLKNRLGALQHRLSCNSLHYLLKSSLSTM